MRLTDKVAVVTGAASGIGRSAINPLAVGACGRKRAVVPPALSSSLWMCPPVCFEVCWHRHTPWLP